MPSRAQDNIDELPEVSRIVGHVKYGHIACRCCQAFYRSEPHADIAEFRGVLLANRALCSTERLWNMRL